MQSAARIEAVDVFCGLGGLSLGLQTSGIAIRAGIDLDPACRTPFEINIGSRFIEQNVETLEGDSIDEHFSPGAIRVLAGCAPCQPFSGYTTKRRQIDDRWRLLLEFQRLVHEVGPSIVTLENVPRLAHLDLWKQFVSDLRAARYEVVWDVLDASDYGVPQSRKRLVLLASKIGPIQLPAPVSKQLTVRDAIGSLRPISAGEMDSRDRMHAARVLTPKNLQRIRASQPAGTWRDWPEDLKADCHRRESGHTYPSVYGRMSWDQPSPTVTTQFYGFGNGRFGHPEQDRAISLREGAILQSFPATFDFGNTSEKPNFRELGRLIGNAVPPKLGAAIGAAIVRHVTMSSAGAAAATAGGAR